MTVGDPSRVDGWMAGTPPPVILRHDRGLRRGEAAGFNARKKAGDEHVFSAKEKIVVAAVVLVAIGSAIAYAAGLV